MKISLWGILPWGLGLEVGVGQSTDDRCVGPVDVELTTLEGYVGARKTFREEHMFRPYIGGGLSFTQADATIEGGGFDFDEDEFTEAVYLRGGLGWHVGIFNFGVDYRYTTFGEFEFGDDDVDIDSGLISIFGGLSF